MGYVVMRQEYIIPYWDRFKAEDTLPSVWSRFMKYIGFKSRFNREIDAIDAIKRIDTAHDDIQSWIKRFGLPNDAFEDRPKRVDLPLSKRIVSETYNGRDMASMLLDTKFYNVKFCRYIYGVNNFKPSMAMSLPVAYISSRFWIEEIQD